MSRAWKKSSSEGSAVEVFWAFLKLGFFSFGGPVAHLGYFRTELVKRRRWVNDDQYGQLLAICQFLPGPASSQLGFSLGLIRAGWLGAFLAFFAFTLPSALLLAAFASAVPYLSGPISLAMIHGLKLVACAVVADAVLGMSKKLCPDTLRRTIAILAAAIVLVAGTAWAQLLVVAGAALVGIFFRSVSVADGAGATSISLPFGRRTGGVLVLMFLGLLFGLPFLATAEPGVFSIAEAFYRAGALVFGGGHVVLPLLQESVVTPGWVTQEQFLAGYGASQAIPGPMFAFSAYLGAVLSPEGQGYLLAATALIFIFLPGFLLICGVLPFWSAVAHSRVVMNAIAGVNAAVVGVLGAALYSPIFTSGISSSLDLAISLVAFALLAVWRVSALVVVLWCVFASVLPVLGWGQ